jgi:putative DNA primase/helicase
MAKNKKAFHEQVAENLIAQLKQGTAPWQKPWRAGDPQAALPMNPATGKRYKGINTLHLMSQPYNDTRWLTYKQASSLGAQVNKGEKGKSVQYWKFFEQRNKTDTNGKPVFDLDGQPIKEQLKLERPWVFYATVFNAQQIDNLPPLVINTPDWDPLERAEQILQASNAVIRHGEADRAFYRPTTDSIHLPFKKQFAEAHQYYATALHELGHWSGHESRLNRDLTHPFGSEGYAKEELRAEIASMLLGSELGIGHDPGQHVAYVGSWIKVLEQDPMEIFRAAADAEKIQDYVLSFSQQQAIVEQEAIGMRNSIPQNNTNDDLTPDLAIVTFRNIKTFKALTDDMPKQEQQALLYVADSLKFYRNHSIDNLEFEETAQKQLGLTIPDNWNGQVRIQGNVIQTDENGSDIVVAAKDLGVEPAFWGVYAQRDDHTFQWLKDFDGERQARDWAEKLELIEAVSERSEVEKAVKLARVQEIRIGNDPNSLHEDIQAAKEQRKAAESLVMVHENEIEQKIVNREGLAASIKTQETAVNKQQTGQQSETGVRKYLVVPYREKDLAKAAGASWDHKAKRWYIGPKANVRALQRWLPENSFRQQTPAMVPELEFAELLHANGCVVEGKHPVMDGSKQRIKIEGDKAGEKSGFYVAHLDGHPAGYFKNNRTGVEIRWKAKGYSFTDQQKAELVAQAAIKQQNRQAEQQAQHRQAANTLTQLLAIAPPADSGHPYLQHKQVRPGDLKVVPSIAVDLPDDSIIKIGQDWQEVKALREEHPDSIVLTAGDLLLPAQDIDGQIWSVQTIQANGAKFFAAGSRKENNFHVAGNDGRGLEAIDMVPAIVIAEGYATADTLSIAMGYPVVAAFDAGNLAKVAQDLHDKYPHKPVIIAGDDDNHQELTNGNNPGKEKALEAAALVDGSAVFPTFAPDEQKTQQLSDFNDLAHQSVLGIDAVKRQVMPVISQAVQEARRQKTRQQIEPQQQLHQKKRAIAR